MPLQIDRRQLNGTVVDLWQVDLSAAGDARILSRDERARAERLLLPEKRRQFIAARAGLRHILSQYIGSPPETLILGTQAFGKPCLGDDSGWQFNLAHSEDTALVVVARQTVGIDLERERSLSGLKQMVQVAFSPQEQAGLWELPVDRQSRAFFRTWTRKEALMKGKGDGFRLAHTFSLPVTEQPLTMTVDQWMITDIEECPGFVVALAVEEAR